MKHVSHALLYNVPSGNIIFDFPSEYLNKINISHIIINNEFGRSIPTMHQHGLNHIMKPCRFLTISQMEIDISFFSGKHSLLAAEMITDDIIDFPFDVFPNLKAFGTYAYTMQNKQLPSNVEVLAIYLDKAYERFQDLPHLIVQHNVHTLIFGWKFSHPGNAAQSIAAHYVDHCPNVNKIILADVEFGLATLVHTESTANRLSMWDWVRL